ncbi:class I adenylate-forming enzyme family protein [Halorientalis halophila]|uniref:class I adenylate-forming enzyme family protein n=1 Tax=Halorientalis halophila TaxID=3108499 RepID=UPI003008AD50
MKQGYDTSTISWTDGIVHHDPDAFGLEREADGALAYPDRPANVPALFDAALDRAPDREAFVYPEYDRTDTYREFDDRVDRLAAGLAADGVGEGDIVSALLSNRPAFVETFFACARLGATVAPINTRVSSRELSPLLADADPAVLITERELAENVDDADYDPDPSSYYVVDAPADGPGQSYESLFETGADPPRADPDEGETCTIMYTSGTTGQPKGCLVSHRNLVNGAINYHVSFDTSEGLRTLVLVPLFHGAGLVSNVLHTLAATGTTVVLDGAGPETFLSTVETQDIEFTLTVPTTYVLAMKRTEPGEYDLSSLQTAAYGGAPMPEENVRRLRDFFPEAALCDAYGTTETTAGLVTMCPDEYSDDYASTIGLPAPPIELAVVDDEREPLGPDEVGELAIRGPIVVDGYRNRPEATAEAFADGWHYTGDLATIDPDGFVSLKGRSRDKIVRGGENIYVLDVEEVLTGHEKVLECSVTGFPDEVLGERVLAAVVPKPGERLTEEELVEHARTRLADYKIPEVFRIVDDLPKNPGGKVLKKELVPEPLRHGIQAGE